MFITFKMVFPEVFPGLWRKRLRGVGFLTLLRSSGFLALIRIGLDVLVHPEEVRGVVLVLERDESVVLRRTIRGPDPLNPFFSQEVHINTAVRKRPHRSLEISRPLDMLLRFPGFHPFGDDIEGAQ